MEPMLVKFHWLGICFKQKMNFLGYVTEKFRNMLSVFVAASLTLTLSSDCVEARWRPAMQILSGSNPAQKRTYIL